MASAILGQGGAALGDDSEESGDGGLGVAEDEDFDVMDDTGGELGTGDDDAPDHVP